MISTAIVFVTLVVGISATAIDRRVALTSITTSDPFPTTTFVPSTIDDPGTTTCWTPTFGGGTTTDPVPTPGGTAGQSSSITTFPPIATPTESSPPWYSETAGCWVTALPGGHSSATVCA
ncbi:hypothetical protein K474DRAFT_1657915 [Panus rudis PR-1116 ss-1]|nr:hypothetical protein K474DRAFT_1657915 [Panus rudis PR-1116 ss-1]